MNILLEISRFGAYLTERVSPGTVGVYLHSLRLWFESLDGVKPSKEAAQSYLDRLTASGISPSTVNLRAHAIIRWFKWKERPITLDCPTIRYKDPEYLMIEEIEKLIEGSSTMFEEVLVVVLFDTAVRINELLGLGVDDIDWANGFISVVSKGGQGRKEQVNISEKGLKALENWLEARTEDSKRVFMDIDYNYAWRTIKKLGKRVGLEVHPHTFRHSRAIHMIMNGSELHTVKEHLRHRNIATTINIYGRFKAVHLKKLVPTW